MTEPPPADPSPSLPCGAGHIKDYLRGALPLSQDPATRVYAREPPQLLLSDDPDWRTLCQDKVARIPAGYTYLMQLLGHDMGHSVKVEAVPHLAQEKTAGDPGPIGVNRYNLIENPATLETIYGPGPGLLPFLYDPADLTFRVVRGARLAQLFTVRSQSDSLASPFLLRALYDERNRDTIMLHELAVVWMQFHNQCARRLMAAGKTPMQAFALARAHCVAVWHDIIAQDLLPRFVHPDLARADLHREWVLDQTTLLAGLFRAFHAMPLESYFRNSSDSHNLQRLMKKGFDTSDAERFRWFFDWDFFLGRTGDGPKTGISASVSLGMRLNNVMIAALDLGTAKDAFPNRLGNVDMADALAKLPQPWRDRISAAQIARDFAAAFPTAPATPRARDLKWGPLYYALMVEAQVHGRQGGFGPLGSALLRTTILSTLARVRLLQPSDRNLGLPSPTTMPELITQVRSIDP